MNLTETAQKILDGKWRHAPGALRACQRGTWAEFAREAAPARPVLVGRLDYGRCLALAERSLAGPVLTKLKLVPLWACSTDDAVSTEWVAVHGVAEEGKPMLVQETGPYIAVDEAFPRADALWDCAVRRWTAATVVESRSYAPDIPLRLRAGSFGVLELNVNEVVSVEVRASEPVQRPTREVPMFATWFEPRTALSNELEAQIRAMCFTAEGEGD